jgi:glucose-6-phosphate 1-dehydrogenase
MEQPHVVVLFGASGDLARRKLIPGLLHLYEADLLHDCRIVGTSLDDLDTEQFVKLAREAVEQ